MVGLTVAKHPAKFSTEVLDAIARQLRSLRVPEGAWILDPFAGVGGIHALEALGYRTVGVELEPEWANAHEHTLVGDSRQLSQIIDIQPQVVATSPAYGNRLADRYAGDAKGSKRFTYRIDLGRDLTEGNGAAAHFRPGRGDDDPYCAVHRAVWEQCHIVLEPGGWMIVNVSNFIRNHAEVDVVGWHAETLIDLGFQVCGEVPVATRRMRFGQNHQARVAHEVLLIARRP